MAAVKSRGASRVPCTAWMCVGFLLLLTSAITPVLSATTTTSPAENGSFACDFDDADDLCGLRQDYQDDFDWSRQSGPTQTNDTGPSADHTTGSTGYYLYTESSTRRLPNHVARLMTPNFRKPAGAEYYCLHMAYHMYGTNIGNLKVFVETEAGKTIIFFEYGDHGDMWWTTDITFVVSSFFRVDIERAIGSGAFGDVAIDDLNITQGACPDPAPLETWEFRCDRPTSTCMSIRGVCNTTTLQCDCNALFQGLQCQIPTAMATCPVPTSPCQYGQCYTGSATAKCECDHGYYGNNCQYETVNATCDLENMTVNIYPYSGGMVRDPETLNGCKLNYSNMDGILGFQGVFSHVDDACDGSATVVSDLPSSRTYQRQFIVFFDDWSRPAGSIRRSTDVIVNVTCTVDLPPQPTTVPTPAQGTSTPPTPGVTTTTTPSPAVLATTATSSRSPRPAITMTATELGASRLYNYMGRQIPFNYVDLEFRLNNPNSGSFTEFQLNSCDVVFGTSASLRIVNNGCSMHPIGVMITSSEMGVQHLYLRAFKYANSPLNMNVQCQVRLCHSSTDTHCIMKRTCLNKRSAEVQQLEILSRMFDNSNTTTTTTNNNDNLVEYANYETVIKSGTSVSLSNPSDTENIMDVTFVINA